ncbi:MAG: DNA repair protein RadA [Gemmatimonadetes bacterium]|nr:DNA repair protein RadA [Gemmatimonadota bacterium]
MPTRARTQYRCSECGADHAKWSGRCDVCGEWNTIAEERDGSRTSRKRAGGGAGKSGRASGADANTPFTGAPARLATVADTATERIATGLSEFDFALGGGIVPGSLILVGGEPGIGKSTVLLQVAAALEAAGRPTLYVSGEESPVQVKLRADRIGSSALDVPLLAETDVATIMDVAAAARPALLIVDSIQTVYSADLEGAPGNVGQVRECAAQLMRFAKESGVAIALIGHVTKGGGIAGPKTLEHIVDTVLYFEGDSTLEHRVLRATKNRFGSVDEIGVFRMTAEGLEGVGNPSALFLSDRNAAHASGSAVTALVEGSRPVLVEVQGLAAKSGYGTSQRVATGVDGKRMAMLLAVLERRAALPTSALDVFVNVVGGARVHEPAGDLAIAAALASSVHDRILDPRHVFIGEVGLGGELRPVTQLERRLAEAARMGMTTAFVPERGAPRGVGALAVRPMKAIGDVFAAVGA